MPPPSANSVLPLLPDRELTNEVKMPKMLYRTPALLADFCRNELPLIQNHIQEQRLLDDLAAIVATDRWNSFDKFHETSSTLTARFEAAGAAVEVYSVPTGGASGNGRWVIAEAADVLAATVAIVKPIQRRIIDYQKNPWQVVQWSAATPPGGLDLELVVIDSLEDAESISRGRVQGKMVLTRAGGGKILPVLAGKGVQALIIDSPVPGRPQATSWQKFGWGGLPLGDLGTSLIGLALSESEGDKLRKLNKKHGSLTLHVAVDIRHYAGSHDVVSGIVKGGGDPQDEVWCLAHSMEPGAADNASGVAAGVEVARVLEELIAAGKLPRPRRSIRFLAAFECYGFFYYLEHGRRLQAPLAGLVVDGIGLKPQLCGGQLYWHQTIPMSAQFVNDVGQVVFQSVLGGRKPIYRFKREPFFSTKDTLLGDPKYGFPCPWVDNCWREPGKLYHGYHSSADTLELLDARGLTACAAGVAGYSYFLANAGNDELCQLASAETERLLGIISRGRKTSPAQADYYRAQQSFSLKRLERWMWGGNRREILAHLAACERKLAEAVAVNTHPHAHTPTHSSAGLIPRRTAPLSPDPNNLLPLLRQRLSKTRIEEWALFWADGSRNLAQITEILACEYGKNVPLNRVNAFFRTQAKLGYVQLIRPEEVLSNTRLINDLQALGLCSGMDVMVHSSLSRIGHVQGGADTVVEALLAVIGSRGTLLMPSFNHYAAKVFNPTTTPTSNGAIPDAMWRRPEAVRSLQASHSVAAIGPKAADWCKNHYLIGMWEQDSPIGRLIHAGGYILSLGVDHTSTSAYHVAETSMPCGCRDPFGRQELIVMPDGKEEKVRGMTWPAAQCPVPPAKLDQALDQRKLQRHGKVGSANCALVKAIDLWQLRREHLKNACPNCPIKPKSP